MMSTTGEDDNVNQLYMLNKQETIDNTNRYYHGRHFNHLTTQKGIRHDQGIHTLP